MDWDWDEGPPRDAPRRRPEEPPLDPAPEGPAPDTTFSGAIEHFERPLSTPDADPGQPVPRHPDVSAPPSDDERTVIIRRPEEPPEPTPDAATFAAAIDRFESPEPYREPAGPDLERPRMRTIEAAQRSLAAGAVGDGYDEGDPRDPSERPPDAGRPRTQVDRAARRARRRRQIRRRRLTALAILVLIVVIIVVLVVRGCGGPAEAQAAVGTSHSSAALRTPAAAGPLRVAACGESDGVHLKTDAGVNAARVIQSTVAQDRHLPAFEASQ